MPTITGTLEDSLGNTINGRFGTQLSNAQGAVFEDELRIPDGSQAVSDGVVSIAPAPSAQLVPVCTYTFRVADTQQAQRHSASGVTVTGAMDTLDDIL
jgi:hypothetical protein